MDKKYQIFISSTFTDLRDERRRVTEAILNLGHIPVGMELFQAGDDSQWTYIQQSIDEADYYVVIVGERYGSEVDGKSYTQMEYEYALEQGVPVAAFLLAEEARSNRPAAKVQFEKKAQIDSFRALCEKKLCQYWEDDKDLALKVNTALSHLFRSKPRIGWVRADQTVSPQVAEELSRLSDEKRQLQAIIHELENNTVLAAPPDVLHRIQQLSKLPLVDAMSDGESPTGYSLLDALLALRKALGKGCDEHDVFEAIRDATHVYIDVDEGADDIMAEFSSRNLVNVEPPSGHIKKRTYYLSEYGGDFIMYAEKWIEERIREEAPSPGVSL